METKPKNWMIKDRDWETQEQPKVVPMFDKPVVPKDPYSFDPRTGEFKPDNRWIKDDK